jgi:hypothetical protein
VILRPALFLLDPLLVLLHLSKETVQLVIKICFRWRSLFGTSL